MATAFNLPRNQTLRCLRKHIYAIISHLQGAVCWMLTHTFLFIHSPRTTHKKNKLLWIALSLQVTHTRKKYINTVAKKKIAKLVEKTNLPFGRIWTNFWTAREREREKKSRELGILFFSSFGKTLPKLLLSKNLIFRMKTLWITALTPFDRDFRCETMLRK